MTSATPPALPTYRLVLHHRGKEWGTLVWMDHPTDTEAKYRAAFIAGRLAEPEWTVELRKHFVFPELIVRYKKEGA